MNVSPDGSINFDIRLGTERLLADAARARAQLSGIATSAENEGGRIDSMINKLGAGFAGMFALDKAREFVAQMVSARSEIQKLEVSFTTLLGSAEKAKVMFSEIREYAVNTPMMLNDLAGAAQMMLSFNIPENDIIKYLKALGDISMGDSQKFQSLSLAFSQMSSTGKLMGQDLLQMINAGFNPLTVMAEKTGKSISELKDEMSEGKISAEMVQKAFIDATSEGGKYYGMLEAQSKTLAGAYSNLQGAVDDMFNDLGEESQGAIATAVEGATFLVKHYEAVGELLMTLVGTFGVYRATLMASSAFANAAYAHEMTQLQALLATKQASMDADLAEAVGKGHLTSSRAAEVQALRAANTERINSLRLSAEEARIDAEGALRKQMMAKVELQRINAAIAAKTTEIQYAELSSNYERVARLEKEQAILVQQRQMADTRLAAATKVTNMKATKAETAAQALSTAQTQTDSIQKSINTKQTTLLSIANRGLKKALDAVKAAWATNPVGIILMGVTLLAGTLMTLNTAFESVADESTRFGEATAKQTSNVETLVAVINNTTKDSKVHRNAVSELCKIYEEYGIQIDKTTNLIDQLNQKKSELITLIRTEALEQQRANAFETGRQKYEEAIAKADKELLNGLQNARTHNGLWNAANDEIRNRADALAAVFGSVVQSHASALVHASGDQYEQVIGQIYKEFQERSTKMGISQETVHAAWSQLGFSGNDFLGDYINDIAKAAKKQEDYFDLLEKGYGQQKKDVDEVTGKLYSSTDSFSVLFDAAYGATQQVKELGKTEAAPQVDKASIDEASSALSGLLSGLNSLLGTNWEIPQIDLSKLPGFSLFSKFLGNTSKNSAIAAIEQKIAEKTKTRNGVSEMTKEVRELLGNAEKGSNDEKILLGYLSRLESAQQAFKNAEANGKKGDAARSKAAQQKAEQEAKKRMEKRMQLAEKERELIARNANDEVAAMEEGRAKALAEIEADYDDRIDAVEKRMRELAKLNKEAGITTNDDGSALDANGLTAKQAEETAKALALAEQLKQKSLRELYESDVQAMRDYLKEYGTLQQQRLAIAQEYADKIAKAQNEGDRKRLERERDAALSGVNAKALANGIDWGATFGAVGHVLTDLARETLQKVEAYMKSAEFRALPADQKKAYSDLRGKLREEVGGNATSPFNFKIWGDVERLTREYQASVRRLTVANTMHQNAVDELAAAQKRLSEATTDAERQAAQAAVDIARNRVAYTAIEVADAQSKHNEAQTTLTETANAATQGLQNFASYIGEIKSGSLYGLANGISKLVTSLQEGSKGVGKALGELGGKIGGIIGAILQIIDAVGEDAAGTITDLLDKVFGMVEGLIHQFFSGQIIGSVFKGTLGGVGDILNGFYKSVTFGLVDFKSWFGSSNGAEVARTQELLAERNESLRRAIEELTDEIADTPQGSMTKDKYDEAVKRQKELEQNTLDIAKAQAGYHGSHHSWNYYWEGFDEQEKKKVSDLLGIDWDGDIWSLTPEQMKKVRDLLPELWKEIEDSGKGDYGKRLTELLDDYIDLSGMGEELKKTLTESLTQVSFSTLFDDFYETLMDIDATGEDVADNLSKYFMKAMLTNQLGKLLKADMEKWQEEFAQAMEDDQFTAEEQEQLRQQYEEMVKKGQDIRDQVAAATGYDMQSDRTAASKGVATASQDSVDEANARMTTIQSHTYSIAESTRLLVTTSAGILRSVNAIEELQRQIADTAEATSVKIASIKSSLDDITVRGVRVR